MAFWRNYYHLTWATKNRLPLIQTEFETQLYSYMIKKASKLDVFVYAINGTEDHMHIVAAIPPKQSVADVVKHLKGASSHYVNHEVANLCTAMRHPLDKGDLKCFAWDCLMRSQMPWKATTHSNGRSDTGSSTVA